jgi:hypothetical protein
MQLYKIRLFLQNALHVSGGFSAHHQKLQYIQHLVFVKPLLLPFGVVEELEQSSNSIFYVRLIRVIIVNRRKFLRSWKDLSAEAIVTEVAGETSEAINIFG